MQVHFYKVFNCHGVNQAESYIFKLKLNAIHLNTDHL